MEVTDITEVEDGNFQYSFSQFFNKINYAKTRFALRKNRISAGVAGTIVRIVPNFKSEIAKLLDTIRKIVNQEIIDPNKKDKIFQKIASLHSEVDRDRTTLDAVFGRTIDLSRVLGEFGSNIEPLIDKIERLKKLIWDGTEKENLLPKHNRVKQISKNNNDNKDEMDDDIPF